MSGLVSLSRKELWTTALLMGPACATGEAGSHWILGYPYSAHDVFTGFYGILVFAFVLSWTRVEQSND